MIEKCDICGEITQVHSRDKEGNYICSTCYATLQSMNSPACVYAIERIDTKKVYVGSTENLSKRYGSIQKPHLSEVKNPQLYDEIKTIGWEGNFKFIVLETFDKNSPDYTKSKRLKAESKWLKKYGGHESNQTYNQRDAIISEKTSKQRKIKENRQINIRINRDTHRELSEIGKKGQSYDDIVQHLLQFYKEHHE